MIKNRIAILNIVILSALLTLFNNCGDGTYIDPMDANTESLTSALSSAAPKLTAAAYQAPTSAAVSLTITDGEPPFKYKITPPTSGAINGADQFVGIKVGVVTVAVTDAEGRVSEIAIDVKAPVVQAPRENRQFGNNR